MAGFDTSIFRTERVQPLDPVNALMRGLQVQGAMQGNALQSAQMQYYQQAKAMELKKAQEEAAGRVTRKALLQNLRPVSPSGAIDAAGVRGPRPEALAAIGRRPKIDAAQLIAAGVPQATIEFLANADTLGMPEVARTIDAAGPNGAPMTEQRDKFGRVVGSAIPKAVELSMTDIGGQIMPVNRYTQTAPLAKTMSPSERDASARGWAGVNLQRDAQNKPTWDPTNQVWADPKTRTVTPGLAQDGRPLGNKKEAEDSRARVKDAKDAIDLINQAEPLLKTSTGSYLGASLDAVAQFFGASTPGAISAQQLKAIEGALVSKMPKMSGPQSDKDVLLYRQMAAVIGDPTVPYPQKAAALGEVRKIQERYAGVPEGSSRPQGPSLQMPADPNAGGWKIERVN